MTRPPNPSILLYPNPIVPAKLCRHLGHSIGVNKASVGQHHHLPPLGPSVSGLMQHLLILAEGDGRTAVLEDSPDHGKARPRCITASHTKQ
jgi:hypothetical protein